MAIQTGDFVELDYTGKVKDSGIVFDTTIEEVAKKNNMSDKHKYEPVIIVVGEKHIVKGLDDFLEGKDPGKYSVDLKDIDAFGKKSAKLLMMVPLKRFKEQNIQPFPGLEINIDGAYGQVKTVSGGRIIVDFNHPLASQDIVYEIDIKKIIIDKAEKINALAKLSGISLKKVTVNEEKADVEYENEIPDELKKMFSSEVERLINVHLH